MLSRTSIFRTVLINGGEVGCPVPRSLFYIIEFIQFVHHSFLINNEDNTV